MAKLTNTQKDKLIAAAQNAIHFTVVGTGEFPTDMLNEQSWAPITPAYRTRDSK
jgi:hypothetical protein